MKIFRKTDTTLTLWQNNWPSIFIPILTILTGSILVGIFGQESKLSCYRASPQTGQCQLDTNSLFSHQTRNIALSTIQKVDIEASNPNPEESSDSSTRVVLVTTNGKIPVSLDGSYEERDAVAAQLDTFLSTPSASVFKLSDGSLFFAYCIAGVTILSCLLFLASGSLTIVQFDKSSDDCQTDTWYIWGKRKAHCAISHIQNIDFEDRNKWLQWRKTVELKGDLSDLPEIVNEQKSTAQRIVITKKSGEIWPLSKKYLSANRRKQEEKIIGQVKEFLQ